MTTDELLATVERRGLTIKVKDGQPHLSGPEEKKTKPLLAMLSERRQEVVERITKVKTVAWVELTLTDGSKQNMTKADYETLTRDGIMFDYLNQPEVPPEKYRHVESVRDYVLPEGKSPEAWQ